MPIELMFGWKSITFYIVIRNKNNRMLNTKYFIHPKHPMLWKYVTEKVVAIRSS